ncbi:MAG: hypothetical protein [Caudoviricetes sp.]|nr:MAG: hypothetical protein [Caudoviricetes sp.]
MSGGGIGKVIGGVVDAVGGIFGGGKEPSKIVNNVTPAKDTAQQEVDKKQQATNAALARKKNRSVLSTGASSMDTGTAQQAKKLLGE